MMSHTQIVNEVKYKMSAEMLRKLLDKGMITQQEFEIADRYNAEKYKPIFKII